MRGKRYTITEKNKNENMLSSKMIWVNREYNTSFKMAKENHFFKKSSYFYFLSSTEVLNTFLLRAVSRGKQLY